jgi:hypothetical protein
MAAAPGSLRSLQRAAELHEVCYRVKAVARLPEMTSELLRAPDMTLRNAGNHVSGREAPAGVGHGDGGGPGCGRLPCLVHRRLPRPPPLSPGRVPDPPGADPAGGPGRQAGPAGQAGQPEGRVGASAKAASRALQAGDRRRRIFCLKPMRKVARPIVIGAGTWLPRKVIKLQDSRRVLRAGSERLRLGRARTSD